MTEEYFKLIDEHAPAFFGCDEKCVDDCTNPDKYNLYTVDKCLERCKCGNGGVIDISGGKFDLKQIVMFGKDKPNGMDFYNEYFDF